MPWENPRCFGIHKFDLRKGNSLLENPQKGKKIGFFDSAFGLKLLLSILAKLYNEA
jgi:hypothetical protein